MISSALLLLAGTALADDERVFNTIQPTGTYNPMLATAVQTMYPKGHHTVKGRFVDHLWHIVLDNADFEEAASNEDLKWLAKQGVLYDNYYAVESNSQANYLAMLGGDTFGLTEERFVVLPDNVSSLAESLDAAHVLWAQYAEDQPVAAYTGWNYPAENPTYSRAKNGFVAFDSVLAKPQRYNNLRTLATMKHDFDSHRRPQWLFIRPNLEHDGTNSNLTTAAKWVRDFLTPHLAKEKHWKRKNFIVTFARASSTTGPNRVWTVVLGDMHQDLRGTVDHGYYDHYTIPATSQANFDLPSLGRYDCNANVFGVINYKAHERRNKKNPVITENYNQGPFGGYFSDASSDLPRPNLNCVGRGHVGLLLRVKKLWKKVNYRYNEWEHNY